MKSKQQGLVAFELQEILLLGVLLALFGFSLGGAITMFGLIRKLLSSRPIRGGTE